MISSAGLDPLPLEVCLRLLESVPVGRVSFYADGEVVTLPVNHAVDGQDVVFRTDRGSKLSAAERQDHVAFEADDCDPRTRTGWSVLVKGRTERGRPTRIRDPAAQPPGIKLRLSVISDQSRDAAGRPAGAGRPAALVDLR